MFFDTVDHQISKLEKVGIRDMSLKMYMSYRFDRKQYVKVNGLCSNAMTISRHLPQRTVLGPMLFLIHINDLLTLQINADIIYYADDTTIVLGGNF